MKRKHKLDFDDRADKWIDRLEKAVPFLIVTYMIGCVLIGVAIVYVAVHFLSKVW
jgi:hypothetical protein